MIESWITQKEVKWFKRKMTDWITEIIKFYDENKQEFPLNIRNERKIERIEKCKQVSHHWIHKKRIFVSKQVSFSFEFVILKIEDGKGNILCFFNIRNGNYFIE